MNRYISALAIWIGLMAHSPAFAAPIVYESINRASLTSLGQCIWAEKNGVLIRKGVGEDSTDLFLSTRTILVDHATTGPKLFYLIVQRINEKVTMVCREGQKVFDD